MWMQRTCLQLCVCAFRAPVASSPLPLCLLQALCTTCYHLSLIICTVRYPQTVDGWFEWSTVVYVSELTTQDMSARVGHM